MAESTASRAVVASPHIHALLARLHAASAAQENSFSQTLFYWGRIIRSFVGATPWTASSDDHMRDKFVALEPDKCQFVYLVARSIGARNIVEAGTSFGVSTIYLALAAGQNVADAKTAGREVTGKVIGTEKEPSKAARAREHWEEAGDDVEKWIELREGDLLETLQVEEGLPGEIDMVLLDIWTQLALPTLKILKPRLRRGAIILADNTASFSGLYKEFLDYLHDPVNGFRTTTTPFKGGFEMAVYLP